LILLAAGVAVFGRSAGTYAGCNCSLPGRPPLEPGLLLMVVSTAAACLLSSFFVIPYLSGLFASLAIGLAAIAACGLMLFMPLASLVSIPAVSTTEPKPRSAFKGAVAVTLIALLLVIGGFGASRLRFFVAPQDIFARDDEVGNALSFFDRRFGGTDFVQIDFRADLRDPSSAARMMRLADILEGEQFNGSKMFADVRSVSQVLGFLGNGFAGMHRIPATGAELGNLWFFLEGSQDIKSLTMDNRKESMIVLRVPSRPVFNAEDMNDAVMRAVGLSSRTGLEAARIRIESLYKAYGIPLDNPALGQVLRQATTPETEQQAAKINAITAGKLKAYLDSPDSPLHPSPEEWSRIESNLLKCGTGTPCAFSAVYSGQMNGQGSQKFAEIVAMRFNDFRNTARCARLAGDLAGKAVLPAPMISRLRGIFSELLSPPPGAGENVTIKVSGFPVVAGATSEYLRYGLLMAAVLLIVASTAVTLVTTRRIQVGASKALESIVAAAITFGMGTLLGIHADSTSGTLYLLPLVLIPLTSALPSASTGAGYCWRHATAFLMGLSASALTLMLTGVLPIVRLGAVMALGMASVAVVSWMFAGAADRYSGENVR
ncbi:MAG: hypothetical protein WC889_09110, partial [Myxococcota bacterium]